MITFWELREKLSKDEFHKQYADAGVSKKAAGKLYKAYTKAHAGQSSSGGKLTMHTHDGEQTHVVHNMKHTQSNADKVRRATSMAAAKHANVSHKVMDKSFGSDHHVMAGKGHSEQNPTTKGKIVHHKTMNDYVKHHAKSDSKMRG